MNLSTFCSFIIMICWSCSIMKIKQIHSYNRRIVSNKQPLRFHTRNNMRIYLISSSLRGSLIYTRAGNAMRMRMRQSDRSMIFSGFFNEKKRCDANFFAFLHRIRIFASYCIFRVFAFLHRIKKKKKNLLGCESWSSSFSIESLNFPVH